MVHPFHFTVLSMLRRLAHAELSLPHNCQLEPLAGLLKLRTLVLPLPLVGGNSAAAAERWNSIGGEPHLSCTSQSATPHQLGSRHAIRCPCLSALL